MIRDLMLGYLIRALLIAMAPLAGSMLLLFVVTKLTGDKTNENNTENKTS